MNERPQYKLGEVCEHGQLKRSCDLCDYIWELSQANARIAELEAENARLAETGQLNVLADIREIVDPMSPGRMMQKELVERIREIMAENARLAAIVAKARTLVEGGSMEQVGLYGSLTFISDPQPAEELAAALAAKEQA